MAPSLSIVSVNRKYAIPVRVHINRKRILLTSLFDSTIESKQSKAIISLKKINNIRLSSRDISSLIETINDEMMEILFKESVSSLKSRSVLDAVPNLPSTSICINVVKPSWKCHLVAPMKFLFGIRERMGKTLSIEDERLLQRLPNISPSKSMKLIVKTAIQNESPVLVEEDEDEFKIKEAESKKMSISYKYSSPYLLNDYGSLSLYVYERTYR